MIRNLRAAFAAIAIAFFATTGPAFAAVDVNTADQTQLQTIKGVGPAISAKIVAERKKGAFKDWDDLEKRVSGIGDKNSAKFSEAGLTVGGSAKGNASVAAKPIAKSPGATVVLPPSTNVNATASTAPATTKTPKK